MFGCVDKRNPVRRVAQEHGPVYHRLEQPLRFTLFDLIGQLTQLGDQVDQAQRLMDIQLVDHEHPACVRVARDRLPTMAHEILLCARLTDRGLLDLPDRDSKADDRALRPVSDGGEFAALDQAWPHRFGRGFALQGLDAGQLIGADDMHPQRVQQGRVRVQRANGFDLRGKRDRIRLGRVQPVATLMRFEIGLALKSARPNGLKCFSQSRV